ncbi:MAG: class I SAM-dependent methyltransferase [Chloroflexi bacterium]|nr:class I SAM-dependent methyltransferase [Chloroflexota bacterium]
MSQAGHLPPLHPLFRYRPIVEDWDAFVDALTRPLPHTVWAHPQRITPQELQHILAEEGIPLTPLPWHPRAFRAPANTRPGRTWAYKVGLFHIQEEVSLLPPYVLAPEPGERVLDMAAAPGNKTAHMALDMENRGTVVANDVDPSRMRALRHVIERLGVANVSTLIYNGSNLPPQVGSFDRVLVDAPCSCEGTSRKNPEVLRTCGLTVSLEHQRLQIAMLRKAILLARPGGRILYATCTYAPEENEVVVDAILREFEGRVRLLPVEIPGLTASPGLTEWAGVTFHPDMPLTLRIWPHQQDTGGFFIALLEKQPQGWRRLPPMPRPIQDVWPQHVVDPRPWLTFLRERYGIPPHRFTNYLFIRRSTKTLYLVPKDHRPPTTPSPDAVGLAFLHVKARPPKLTTAGALMFGRWATRHTIPLTAHQRDAYLARHTVTLAPEQTASCTRGGFVIVTYRGFPLGMGIYRPGPPPRLESAFPKGWMRG